MKHKYMYVYEWHMNYNENDKSPYRVCRLVLIAKKSKINDNHICFLKSNIHVVFYIWFDFIKQIFGFAIKNSKSWVWN